jgi:hypothetical protein
MNPKVAASFIIVLTLAMMLSANPSMIMPSSIFASSSDGGSSDGGSSDGGSSDGNDGSSENEQPEIESELVNCPDGSQAATTEECPAAASPTELVECPDGSQAATLAECPTSTAPAGPTFGFTSPLNPPPVPIFPGEYCGTDPNSPECVCLTDPNSPGCAAVKCSIDPKSPGCAPPQAHYNLPVSSPQVSKLPDGSCPAGALLTTEEICREIPLLPGSTTGSGGGFIQMIPEPTTPTTPTGQP